MIEKLKMVRRFDDFEAEKFLTKLNEVIDYLNYIQAPVIKSVPDYAVDLQPGQVIRVPNGKEEAIATQDMDIAQYTDYKRGVYNPIESKAVQDARREPKWKVGDRGWCFTFKSVYEVLISSPEKLEMLLNDPDPIFKTKEQAEQALAEIRGVLRRYQ